MIYFTLALIVSLMLIFAWPKLKWGYYLISEIAVLPAPLWNRICILNFCLCREIKHYLIHLIIRTFIRLAYKVTYNDILIEAERLRMREPEESFKYCTFFSPPHHSIYQATLKIYDRYGDD